MSTELTIQPSAKDNYLYEGGGGDNNFGTLVLLALVDDLNRAYRPILEFDLSEIPANQTILSATLQLYYHTYYGTDPVGKTIWAYKLTRTDWVEIESTWLIYKTGSDWTSAGGDYVTSDPVGGSLAMPADYGWLSINVLAIVQDAYAASNPAEFLVKFATEGVSPGGSDVVFHSNNYTDNTSLRPKLVVEYETTVVDVTVEVTLATADASANAPTMSIGSTLLPLMATADATGLIPVIFAGIIIEAPVATANGAGLVPTLSIGSTLLPPVATADAAGVVPEVRMSLTIQVPVGTIDAEALAAILSIGLTLLPPVATITATGLTPTLSIGITLLPLTATITAEGKVPTLSMGVTVLVPLATADAEALIAIIITKWIELTLRPRSLAMTLQPRSLSMTLKPRSINLTLQPRSLSMTLKPRSLSMTLPKKRK